MAGLAGTGWYWDPERFQNVCNVPPDTISSNPSPTVRDKVGGRRDPNGRDAGERGEITSRVESGWKRRKRYGADKERGGGGWGG
ncbi:uncharacterized protein V6R79_012475 [Siganus canaliculatus]